MKLSHTIRLALTFLLVLATVGAASAEIVITTYEHDAMLTAPLQETRVCGCGASTDYFILENYGDFPASFRLQLETQVAWIELGTNDVFLQPGEQRAIPVHMNAPCGAELDAYYVVYASSEYGRYRATDRSISAEVCEAIGLHVIQHDRIVGPCEEAQVEFVITNTATYEETYSVEVDDEHVTLSENRFSLQPGQSRTVYGTAQYACDAWGDREYSLEVSSERTRTTVDRTIPLTLMWDYDFLVDMNSHADVCAEITTEREITVTNTGAVENAYSLSLNHPEAFTQLSETFLRLAPGESRTVLLWINPTEEHLGETPITLTTVSEVGSQTKTNTMLFNSNDCYEHNVVITPQEYTVCAGTGSVNVQVQNRGLYTEEFTIGTSGDLYAQTDDTYMSLRSGEHQNTALEIGVPDRDETYNVDVHVTQSPGISSTTPVTVHAVSNYQCTLVQVDSSHMRVWTDQQVVPVIITNNGREATLYQLDLEGKAFDLSTDDVFLAPGEQAVIHLVKKADVDPGRYVERFRLTSDRSEYRHDFRIDLKDKGFMQLVYERIAFGGHEGGLDWCLFVLFALLVVLGLVVLGWILVHIGALPFETTWLGDRTTTATVLTILAIAFALIAIGLAVNTTVNHTVIDEQRGTDYSALYYEFPSNTIFDLDLGQYFSDPDGDALSYSVNQPGNFEVVFEGSIARIKPERNWAGEHELVFTATDAQGSSADSPIMTVRVLKTAPISFWGYIATYCWPLNFAVLAIICLVLMAFTRFVPNDENLEKNRNHLSAIMHGEVVEATPLPARRSSRRAPAKVDGDVVAGNKVTNVVVNSGRKAVYVGSKGGKRVHQADCIIAQRIPKEKRVVVKSEEEAVKEGWSSCKVCVPFEK